MAEGRTAPPDGVLLTDEEVATMLRLSTKRFQLAVNAGKAPGGLKPLRVSRFRRWRRAEVEAWVLGQ